RIGPLDFTTLASKQEGRSERAVYSGGGASVGTNRFTDLDWAHGQYFLLYDPNFLFNDPNSGTVYDLVDNSLQIYEDDAIASNDAGSSPYAGKAFIDPGGALRMPLTAAQRAAAVPGSFVRLTPGADKDYELLSNVYAFHDTVFKVIRLKQPI